MFSHVNDETQGRVIPFTSPNPNPENSAPIEAIDVELLRLIVEGAREKKAIELRILDVRGLHSIFDYFVITTANNPRQMRSITESVEEYARLQGGFAKRSVEGLSSTEWVLLDYGAIAVNVFSEDARNFYALERLWADAREVEVDQETATSTTLFV